MKPRASLSAKIFLLAFLNVILLGVVFFLFARIEFRFELSSFLLAPARDRILSVSRLIALQLPTTPPDKWHQMLAQYSASYPAEFYLFDSDGRQLAGNPVQLPPQLKEMISQDPFAHGRAGPRLLPLPPSAHGEEDHGAPVFCRVGNGPQRYWVGVHIPIWTNLTKEPLHGTLVWRIQSFLANPFFFDYRPWLAIILAVIAVSVACWLPFIRGLTHSISQLTRATSQIAGGGFNVALPSTRRDELGRLSDSINRMAHRLSEFVNGQRRFLGDIAHELCSPIARIQMAVGILEQRATRQQAEYVKDVREEVEHMSALVNELLSFSKAQINANAQLTRVNVAETVSRVQQREASEGVEIQLAISENLEVMAQPEYLFRSLANIVRNAIRYAGHAGPVLISAKNGDDQVKITVSDSGPGIAEAELEQIFKPFYRPDQARQRDTGGIGLGLAIVKTCIEACNGSVACRNLSPHGLEVEIRLPAA